MLVLYDDRCNAQVNDNLVVVEVVLNLYVS